MAITAALLVGLGFNPLYFGRAVLSIVNTAPVFWRCGDPDSGCRTGHGPDSF
ncbi:L-lactate permease [Salmonella enterica subsp. enterica]|nr:L-lactate permease [Salmonella enterica subsp. enterica]